MKQFYKFLFYKLYRFAKLQELTVNPIIGFLGLVSIFEILHLLILMFIIEDFFNYKFTFNSDLEKIVGILFVIIGFTLNYFIFIKTKLIDKIDKYFEEKKRNIWKENLLFFGYIIFLFVIMIIQTLLYKK